MTDSNSNPPASGRFRKGVSGNLRGRPRAQTSRHKSAFDILIDRTLPVVQNGEARQVSAEEALQIQTLKAALAGSRAAQREVLKMIDAREKWYAARAPEPGFALQFAYDPDNANEAMLMLDIATIDEEWKEYSSVDHLELQPWAVQAGLSRRGRKGLTDKDIEEIKRSTKDADSLRWPRRRGQ